jgi:selenide,water dikinase
MSDLAHVLRDLPQFHDPRILAGKAIADDAGVFRLRKDLALIQTVDFFTPIVDDAYTFGQIAAANALSDIYAMGGLPLTALNITVFPTSTVPISVLSSILAGGSHKAIEAGVVIIGGHTVDGEEPIYGLSVTGTIHPDRVIKPSGGRVGDVLLLTKPLGTGVIATAMKAGRATEGHAVEAVEWMRRLNAHASAVMIEADAHASTDITGFGFAGHLSDMALASGVAARVNVAQIPFLSGAYDYAHRGFIPTGGRSNQEFYESRITAGISVSEDTMALLYDPQTSGGLLMAIDAGSVDEVTIGLESIGESGWVVGALVDGTPGTLLVTN